ncbi:A/G-specific adenine glycosylase [Porphyromonas circumdentaria]|uniref:Adenine DNA glycosylase n=1 Tax=Porphyromonas circumdentaria TaxID=29524 RepID=A0A1T4L3B5_9PORP|nr:A/G-specific adenine glycosylase [Porphyromonas circumdentaria]MBB6275212.1 A/G-specific adenine glycosylase [Porphyromonas circumdentaria]SJZ49194.1 A/G-specific DNA-adenine glycosylase [Porphyromonas circumdentaria]
MPLPISQRIPQALQEWYLSHHRALPWRETQDPYRIWVSEIILQQTRVNQGLEYYERFIAHFPTVKDLAEAPEDKVLLLWQGLGYYSRARNLHRAAQMVMEQHDGHFPREFLEIRALPGIGDYTAGAISSFAYNSAYPAVDGNVLRVMSRITACTIPIDTTTGKKVLTEAVSSLLKSAEPSIFNQAVIELGALICTPKKPQCSACPISQHCALSGTPEVELYPYKEKQISIRHRYLNYIVIASSSGGYFIRKREDKDIWRGLYEFPLMETNKSTCANELLDLWKVEFAPMTIKSLSAPSFEMEHKLSHQLLHIRVYRAEQTGQESLSEPFLHVTQEELANYAFPVPLARFIKKHQKELSTPLNLLL